MPTPIASYISYKILKFVHVADIPVVSHIVVKF